ncbi:hypothetical protein H9P43_008851 [Blastocladiella emersonii ATCC 22665]|nr:hypothetical protein H9P43_008851 [Blastocladiella emersonii ATCC 22665]
MVTGISAASTMAAPSYPPGSLYDAGSAFIPTQGRGKHAVIPPYAFRPGRVSARHIALDLAADAGLVLANRGPRPPAPPAAPPAAPLPLILAEPLVDQEIKSLKAARRAQYRLDWWIERHPDDAAEIYAYLDDPPPPPARRRPAKVKRELLRAQAHRARRDHPPAPAPAPPPQPRQPVAQHEHHGRRRRRPHPGPRARRAARRRRDAEQFWQRRAAAAEAHQARLPGPGAGPALLPMELPRHLRVPRATRDAMVRGTKHLVRGDAGIDVCGIKWLPRLLRLHQLRDDYVRRGPVPASTPAPRIVPKLKVRGRFFNMPFETLLTAANLEHLDSPITRDTFAAWPKADYTVLENPNADGMEWAGALERIAEYELEEARLAKHDLCWRLRRGAQPINQFFGSIVTDGHSVRVLMYRDGMRPHDHAPSTSHVAKLGDPELVNRALAGPLVEPDVEPGDPPLVFSPPPQHRVARRRGAGMNLHQGPIPVRAGKTKSVSIDPGANSPIDAISVSLPLLHHLKDDVVAEAAALHANPALDDDALAAALEPLGETLLDVALTKEGLEHRFDGISATEFHHKTGSHIKSRRSRKSRKRYHLDEHDRARAAAAHPAYPLVDKIRANVAAEEETLAEAGRAALGRLNFFTYQQRQKMFDGLAKPLNDAVVRIGHQFTYGRVRVPYRGPVVGIVDQLVRRGVDIFRVAEGYTSKRCAVCTALSTPQQRTDGACDLVVRPRTPWTTKHCPRCHFTFSRDHNAAFNILLVHAPRLEFAPAV